MLSNILLWFVDILRRTDDTDVEAAPEESGCVKVQLPVTLKQCVWQTGADRGLVGNEVSDERARRPVRDHDRRR